MKFEKMSVPCGIPNLNWFKDLELPKFRTANVVGLEIRDCSSIIYTNDKGQEINVARSTGTDYVNREKIKNSIEVKGIQVDVIPPVILSDGTSIDGFTRGGALKVLEQEKWVYLVVKLRDGFLIEDLKDELGLGCNNHSPSKPATEDDFEVRLRNWIVRQENSPTVQECMNWWNSIPHSFTQKLVENRCNKVVNNIMASSSMVSFTKESAETAVKKILKEKLPENAAVIAINNGNNTYHKRAFFEALEAVAEGKVPVPVGFLQNVTAEKASDERKKLAKQIAKMNKMFRSAAEKYNTDPTFELLSIEGFIPQALDIEDNNELVKV
jgi:hypothetical protein